MTELIHQNVIDSQKSQLLETHLFCINKDYTNLKLFYVSKQILKSTSSCFVAHLHGEGWVEIVEVIKKSGWG